jgi:hypothetical protein
MEESTKGRGSFLRKRWVLVPGHGALQLHLRQDGRRVSDLLGAPDKIEPGTPLREFWLYLRLGIDVSISTTSGRVLSLFFFRQGSDGHKQADIETDRGISVADSKRKVLAAYGTPYKQDESYILSTGERVKAWFSYVSGIGFHFGADERVDTISIFARVRSQRPKR